MNPRTMHDFETIPALVNILCDIYKKFKGENVALAIDMPVVEVPMSPYSPGSTGWQNPIPEPVCISSSKVDEVIADGTTKDEDDGIQAYIKENPVGIAKKNEPEF